MAHAVAVRYAKALVDLVARPSSSVSPTEAVAQLTSFARVLAESPELENVLLSPAVSSSRKRAVIGRLASDLSISKLISNFLFVLVDHRRVAELNAIRDAFDALMDERMGVTRVRVAAARELNDRQRQGLRDRLSALTGNTARLEFAVDPELLGGAIARIGSTIYDGSVRGQLEALRRRLSAE